MATMRVSAVRIAMRVRRGELARMPRLTPTGGPAQEKPKKKKDKSK